ncbi:uncharacterized protein LOC141719565 [Apium graveolens]|uniref:uncharacterized protein LOC141719565 n=1 Tax=Apium graveolens TaxID=4045 RepID=UPI003D79D70B
MMNSLPSIAQAFSLIKQEEKQRQGYVSSNAFLGNVKIDASTASTIANANTASNDTLNSKRQGLGCNYCHKEGHTKENCFKLIGYPPRGRGKGKFSGVQGGFRTHPAQMQTNQQANNIHQSVSSSPQLSLEQIQKQMARISQMVSNLASPATTPVGNVTLEDHVSSIAGSGPAAYLGNWC